MTADLQKTAPEDVPQGIWKEILEHAPAPPTEESFEASLRKTLESVANLSKVGTLTEQEAQVLLKHITAAAISWRASRQLNYYFLCPKCREKLKVKRSSSPFLNILELLQIAAHRP